MAHFAQLDDNNIVIQVIVIDNENCLDKDGLESEVVGAAFCAKLLGGTWLKTSYNDNIRKNYAGIDFTYDRARDAFIAPQPYPSWKLVEETCQWEAPIPYPIVPEGSFDYYTWNETTQAWDLIE